MITGKIVSEAYEQVMRETEDPFTFTDLLFSLGDTPQWWHPFATYRDWLHRPRINVFGQRIPQITIVRQNLRRFKMGNTLIWRGPHVQDRRQTPTRRHR